MVQLLKQIWYILCLNFEISVSICKLAVLFTTSKKAYYDLGLKCRSKFHDSRIKLNFMIADLTNCSGLSNFTQKFQKKNNLGLTYFLPVEHRSCNSV